MISSRYNLDTTISESDEDSPVRSPSGTPEVRRRRASKESSFASPGSVSSAASASVASPGVLSPMVVSVASPAAVEAGAQAVASIPLPDDIASAMDVIATAAVMLSGVQAPAEQTASDELAAVGEQAPIGHVAGDSAVPIEQLVGSALAAAGAVESLSTWVMFDAKSKGKPARAKPGTAKKASANDVVRAGIKVRKTAQDLMKKLQGLKDEKPPTSKSVTLKRTKLVVEPRIYTQAPSLLELKERKRELEKYASESFEASADPAAREASRKRPKRSVDPGNQKDKRKLHPWESYCDDRRWARDRQTRIPYHYSSESSDADVPVAVATQVVAGPAVLHLSAMPADSMPAETQVAPPESRPLSPILAEGAAGGTQVIERCVSRVVIPPSVPAKLPVVTVKGVCEVCGKDVLSNQERRSTDDNGYVHLPCLKDLGACLVCSKKVFNVHKGHKQADNGYVHAACCKGGCQKCGKAVLATHKRFGENGEYWHEDCYLASDSLGKCAACGKWVLKADGGVRIRMEGGSSSFFHTACAPPS
jgi:hypothetical protein